MYQAQNEEITEEDLNKVIEAFNKSVGDLDSLIDTEYDSEFDMKKIYIPNHVTSWNSISDRERPCIILQKNHQIALVQFVDAEELEPTLPRIFRLDDLSPTNMSMM